MPPTTSSDSASGSDVGAKETASDHVAKEAIYINGVRAYNKGDRVSASAVKNNKLDKLVDKV